MIPGENPALYTPLHAQHLRMVCLFLSWMCTSLLSAQHHPTGQALTIEDGLGFRSVTSITQDRQGLMWIGTRQGLNRYDSYRFTRFGNDRRADQFFPGGDILIDGIHTVSDSLLWMVADYRLYTFNRNNFHYRDITESSAIHGKVLQLQPAMDGSMWAVWENEGQLFLGRSEAGTPFKKLASVAKGRRELSSLAIDTAGYAWWSSVNAGLRKYTPQGQLLHEVQIDSSVWYGTMRYFSPVFVDKQNRVFVFPKSKNQIWLYHPDERRIEVIADSLSTIAYNVAEDNQGNLWFSTKTELFRWNPDRSWTDYSEVLKEALQFSIIHGIYEDQTNLLWVATDNGLIRIPNRKQYFQTRISQPGVDWGNEMRSIFEDRSGRVYAYCEFGDIGIHRVSFPESRAEKVFIPGEQHPNIYFLEEAKHFIADQHENVVWTLTDQLIKIDLTTMKPISILDFGGMADKFSSNPLTQLKDGSFLLGSTLDRLTVYHPVTENRTKLLKESRNEFTSIPTRFFLENMDGSIWVATDNNGLYRISRDGKIIRNLTTETSPALSNNHLLALYYDADSILWIGTFGGGLNRFDETANTIRIFDQKEGLADDNVTGILSDAEGNIWASTYNGLSCLRKKEGSIQNFYEDDGLSNNEFNYTSFYKDRQGRLWFGGMNGVQYFNPAEILEQRPNPPMSFTGFSKYNRLLDSLETSILGDLTMAPIQISPYDSYFQLTWTLPNYFNPEKNRYYVWLEGLENDWSYIGNIPTIRFHKLPAGDYVLHIKGADSKGNWSVSELSVPIHVNQIFFRTWWFIAACILVIGSLIYAFARYRLQRLLEMERMRTRIAGDLHDEVGSMLSGLAMQAEIMELDQEKADSARLHRIIEISRLTLSKMRDVVWSIDSRRDQVKDLLDRMRENAEEMLTPRDIIFQFELGELPLEKKLPVDERQHLFLFYKEAINNIAKHSNATQVTIHFGQFADHFELSIQDNGTAFASGTTSSGFGLQNLEMRAKKLGATFLLNKEEGFKVGLRMKSI
ncbi:MAG TPA: two-component regulator propeller domain-containing protein [Saprospiraceae bacterium]|nr:two-component regulator propeller domain-containing protein [Saprospiraceae bacterium]